MVWSFPALQAVEEKVDAGAKRLPGNAPLAEPAKEPGTRAPLAEPAGLLDAGRLPERDLIVRDQRAQQLEIVAVAQGRRAFPEPGPPGFRERQARCAGFQILAFPGTESPARRLYQELDFARCGPDLGLGMSQHQLGQRVQTRLGARGLRVQPACLWLGPFPERRRVGQTERVIPRGGLDPLTEHRRYVGAFLVGDRGMIGGVTLDPGANL